MGNLYIPELNSELYKKHCRKKKCIDQERVPQKQLDIHKMGRLTSILSERELRILFNMELFRVSHRGKVTSGDAHFERA